MFDKFSFFDIQKEDVDKKLGSMLLTTAVSVAGLAVLVVVSALLDGDDKDEESEQDDSQE